MAKRKPRSRFWVVSTHILTVGFAFPFVAWVVGAILVGSMFREQAATSTLAFAIQLAILAAGQYAGTLYSLSYIRKVAIIEHPTECIIPSIVTFSLWSLSWPFLFVRLVDYLLVLVYDIVILVAFASLTKRGFTEMEEEAVRERRKTESDARRFSAIPPVPQPAIRTVRRTQAAITYEATKDRICPSCKATLRHGVGFCVCCGWNSRGQHGPDVEFTCPHCGQLVVGEEDLADKLVTCPTCKAEVHLRRKIGLRSASVVELPHSPVTVAVKVAVPSAGGVASGRAVIPGGLLFTCPECRMPLELKDVGVWQIITCSWCRLSTRVTPPDTHIQCPDCRRIFAATKPAAADLQYCPACNSEAKMDAVADALVAAYQTDRSPNCPVCGARRDMVLHLCSNCSYDPRFACPNCSSVHGAFEEMAGAVATCPCCHDPLRVPDRVGETIAERSVPEHAYSNATSVGAAQSEKTCPRCRNKVWSTASACAICGYDFMGRFPLEESASNVESTQKRAMSGAVMTAKNWWIIVMVAVVVGVYQGYQEWKARSPDPRPTVQPAYAAPVAHEPVPSQAWLNGYTTGRSYGRMDRELDAVNWFDPDFAKKVSMAGTYRYSAGTPEYGDFWDGYRHGYAETR